jgi:hypothetical protein
MVSKVDLAVIFAVVAGYAFWFERGHRIVIDAPTPSELATASAAVACPDNDRAPYSADCLAFLKGNRDTAMGWRIVAADRKPTPLIYPARHTELTSAECPNNDSIPYPPNCLRFMSGPFWRPE